MVWWVDSMILSSMRTRGRVPSVFLSLHIRLQERWVGGCQGGSRLHLRHEQGAQPGREGGEDVQSVAEILAGLQVGPGYSEILTNILLREILVRLNILKFCWTSIWRTFPMFLLAPQTRDIGIKWYVLSERVICLQEYHSGKQSTRKQFSDSKNS